MDFFDQTLCYHVAQVVLRNICAQVPQLIGVSGNYRNPSGDILAHGVAVFNAFYGIKVNGIFVYLIFA